MVKEVPSVKLNDGNYMPMVGLGTYARKAEPGQYARAVRDALAAGYRHVDTASSYHNEEEVGAGLAQGMEEGPVTREQLFVTTKVWNDRHAEDQVVPALRESLQRLKLDYVDLFLIHWPVSTDEKGSDAKVDFLETWRGMEKARQLGLTRSIGVSNFNTEQLDRLMQHANVPPAVNQVEISPTLTQRALVSHCVKLGVQPVAYTPLGLLSDARPEFSHLQTAIKDQRLQAMAASHDKTVAQIALRYLIQRGIPVIPKSFTESRIVQNLELFDFELTQEELALMEGFNLDHRCVPASGFRALEYYPF